MAIQDSITQIWVKLTGRKVNSRDHNWLFGPIGDSDIIKDKFIDSLAKKEDLNIVRNEPNSGLLEKIEDIGIDDTEKKKINSEVIHFYEKTHLITIFKFGQNGKEYLNLLGGYFPLFSASDCNN
jgi:hypothetical protein